MTLTINELKARKKSLGGSDIGAICGLSKYRSAIDVYLDKINPEVTEQEHSEPAYWGNTLEDIIAKEYAKRTGAQISVEKNILYNSEYPWAHATIDRWIDGGKAVLECKTADRYLADKWGDESDKVPETYLAQCAWYAAVLNVPYVDIAVLIGGNNFRLYKYNRNKNLEKNLLRIGKEFWNNHVIPRIPPAPTDGKEVMKLFAEDNGMLMEASPEDIELYENLKEKKMIIKQVANEVSEIENKLKVRIGEHQGLRDANGNKLITWKHINRVNLFDLKRFKEENPEMYEKYTAEQKGYRSFLVK